MKYTEDSLLLGQLIENYKKYYSKVFKIITEEEESQTQSYMINSGAKLREKQKNFGEIPMDFLGKTESINSIDFQLFSDKDNKPKKTVGKDSNFEFEITQFSKRQIFDAKKLKETVKKNNQPQF